MNNTKLLSLIILITLNTTAICFDSPELPSGSPSIAGSGFEPIAKPDLAEEFLADCSFTITTKSTKYKTHCTVRDSIDEQAGGIDIRRNATSKIKQKHKSSSKSNSISAFYEEPAVKSAANMTVYNCIRSELGDLRGIISTYKSKLDNKQKRALRSFFSDFNHYVGHAMESDDESEGNSNFRPSPSPRSESDDSSAHTACAAPSIDAAPSGTSKE